MELNEDLLAGGDLRSIGKSNSVVLLTRSPADLDKLFKLMFSNDRLVAMRSADAVEKITKSRPEYLAKHKAEIIQLCTRASNKELQWHLALLISRLSFTPGELKMAWELLLNWAMNTSNSKIVRANALTGLSALTQQDEALKIPLYKLFTDIAEEKIPSLNARIRKIRKNAW